MELTLDRLTKQFGARIAVDRVSATLVPGVTGLLGANGAGKTTLMRMVCDVVRPTGGQILLDGRDATELGDEYRAMLGYLPQDFGCYPDFSALDFMRYMATLKGLSRRDARERSKIVILSTHIVSDVEFIASRILVMRQGSFVMDGSPGHVVAHAAGKVWECHVDARRAGAMTETLTVANVRYAADGHAVVRVVDEEPPLAGAVVMEPTLEDLYLLVFRADGGR